MSFFCIGLVRGYSSPAVPSIMENSPDLLPTKNIASWASTMSIYITRLTFPLDVTKWFRVITRNELIKGSIAPLGAMFGSMTAFPMLHFYGRKYTLLLASPLWTVAWISIATAANWKVVIMGRILSGFCVGLCLPSAQIYVGDDINCANARRKEYLYMNIYCRWPKVQIPRFVEF